MARPYTKARFSEEDETCRQSLIPPEINDEAKGRVISQSEVQQHNFIREWAEGRGEGLEALREFYK